ncbi:hypothetical protein SAMD00023353_11200050 [Rosellinia necatrix]|uniref:Uncharacterized protein n=1 Tax=Rosellinia necatrix TaxID=77044 RepID=A0A1S8ABN6_ROSNE|nr:hypothetical protein SAMD00023353_11200050 [Rosellinia necatrix]
MQPLAILCAILLASLGAALPAESVPSGPPNILSPVQGKHVTPAVVEGLEPYIPGVSKRSVSESLESRKAELHNRAILIFDIWEDVNQGGRQECLVSNTQTCYNLENGWNDLVSSLLIPSGFGCIFYQNINCDPFDFQLIVTGAYYVSNVGDYGFNDIISSYLCYN